MVYMIVYVWMFNQVEVRSDEVVVTANPEDLKTSKRLKSMCRLDPRNKNTFVLVGGGMGSSVEVTKWLVTKKYLAILFSVLFLLNKYILTFYSSLIKKSGWNDF